MALSPTRVSPEPCSVLAPGGAYSPRSLSGGTANRGLVIRVGDTVIRPIAPCWRATHALLDHLAAVGFDGAPRALAAGQVTETLTYIDGRAGVPPLAEDTLTDAALVSVAGLLRRADRRRVAEAVVANHDWTYAIVTEAAAAGHQGFADHWRLVAEQAARARHWCQQHHRDLLAAAR